MSGISVKGDIKILSSLTDPWFVCIFLVKNAFTAQKNPKKPPQMLSSIFIE